MARAKLSLVAVALGACAHPRPAAGPPPPGAVVEVVDPGAAPRRALRYRPVRGLDHPVALTWGGGWRSSGASCLGAFDTRAQFDDVVLVGAVAGDLPADAALALRGGTTTHQDNPFVARHEIELRAVLPARYALVGDASAVTAAAGGDERFGQVVRAALPRFPRQAIGVGARWTVTEARDGGTRRVTWTLRAITGDRVTLAATIGEHAAPPAYAAPGDGVGPWSGSTVDVTIDLARFTVEAAVTRRAGSGGTYEDTAATLVIGARR
ncbi:MAG: hypothetical protein JNK64_39390 [Myxococcales bacterium]|nr:hypothetical protein [Myxococcales bacterium]